MKASEAPLLDLLWKAHQFEIPIYQRTYSWTSDECRTLWDDVIRAGQNDATNVHFVGSVVHISKGQSNLTKQEPLLVIDGQQRLTSVILILKALAVALTTRSVEDREPLDGFSPNKITNRYLLNADEDDTRRYKLLLTQTDKDTLISIVDGIDVPRDHSVRIRENYEWFTQALAGFSAKGGDLASVCKGLAKLMVVDIALSRDQENPQLIFESMNSTGKELSQADLIRNYVLMGLPARSQTRLYNTYWRPMELEFGQAAYADHFDPFVRHYLTVKTGSIPKESDIYSAFKEYTRQLAGPDVAATGEENLELLLVDLKNHSHYYRSIALNQDDNPALNAAFRDVNELKSDTAYPLFLEMYDDYATGTLTQSDLVRGVRLIESYVFRRAVCNVPTNSLNKTFATVSKFIDKSRYLESLTAHLVSLKTYKRFPTNDEFEDALVHGDAYHFRRRSYLLRRLENFDTKEPTPVSNFTIEHVMPQNPNLSQEWRTELGNNWEDAHALWLHTLGNLTLTGYNSEYSDRSFQDKLTIKGGFRDSPLRLNQSVKSVAVWDADAIKTRGEELTKTALLIWPRPQLDEETTAQYESPRIRAEYSIDDFPGLRSGPRSQMYADLRTEILALDESVTEDFKKHYVSFSSLESFVDIIPLDRELTIQAKMPMAEVEDPFGLCEDISDRGHWGTGNIRYRYKDPADFHYAMGLIRQAYEWQSGAAG